ncbi:MULTISPECIES: hypothetical protein [Bacteria]|uniref:hypothetical protein n=1 Tax=Bacteria TaxID=2 RepID=UPI003C7CCD4E
MTEAFDARTLPAHLAQVFSSALTRFGAVGEGRPQVGWHGRTAGLRVFSSEHGRAWLRIVMARPELARGDWWNGNLEAPDPVAMRRPRVLAWDEWALGSSVVRAELMELLPGAACSPSPELRNAPGLSEEWWDALEDTLQALASHRTGRAVTTPESIVHRAHVLFGVKHDLADVVWTTCHGDLHWANLFAPAFALVDWESWGCAPAGSDIVTLYLHSLLVPDIAEGIRDRFPGVFASRSGEVAIVYAGSRMLARAMSGDYPDLIDPIHRTIREHGPSRGRKA